MRVTLGQRQKLAWLVGMIAGAAIVASLIVPAIPQDPSYHFFADGRRFFSTPNFLNVASNLGFLGVGLFGLLASGQDQSRLSRPAYLVFCGGVMLVAVGSAYYHYRPDNASLVWDRLPMTVAFMALLAIVIEDRLAAALGRRLLWPLVSAGIASVCYWEWTEVQGRGDLRAYGLVQFLPMLLIPLMLIGARGPGLRDVWLWRSLGAYACAKFAEYFDEAIFRETGRLISGHSLKHLLATLAVLAALLAMRRLPREMG